MGLQLERGRAQGQRSLTVALDHVAAVVADVPKELHTERDVSQAPEREPEPPTHSPSPMLPVRTRPQA